MQNPTAISKGPIGQSLIFPWAWLASVFIACATKPNLEAGISISMFLGFLSYTMSQIQRSGAAARGTTGQRASKVLWYFGFSSLLAFLVFVVALTRQLDPIVAVLILFLWGIVCFFVTANTVVKTSLFDGAFRRAINRTVAFAVIAASSIMVPSLYGWITWDPVGSPNDLGWGSASCSVSTLSTVPIGSDDVAEVREATCPSGFFLTTDFTRFVFVHRRGEEDRERNLVFRYDVGYSESYAPPEIKIVSSSTIQISISSHQIFEVTRQRRNADDLQIRYALAAAAHPPALQFWQRSIF